MTIVKLFETQVEKTPASVAVRFQQKELTYTRLNQNTNQLAHHLQKLGVGKEQMVGLFLERSLEMVVGILGVLKAGGAYVPLDPDYPADRVVFMLEDTRVPILLTQSHLSGKLSTILASNPGLQNLKIIYLDSEWDEIAREGIENPTERAELNDLAYTIYTSGSTGKPKGVMNEHRGIYNRMVWMLDALPLSQQDRIVQKTPYSFDVSLWEFLWPLLSGACLVVSRPGGHKDSDYLVNLIVEESITAIHFVPSMLQVFLLNGGVERCTSLKRVLCSGEALPYELQERFHSRLDAELFNLYGPTEAAIEVTFWACQRKGELTTVPIGHPLVNTQIHILDPELRPVPVGEAGELHIGGIQVARGYLNRPDLTAERFIPDPFSADPAARLYKTGDMASRLPDGTILYLGRMDYQVKIRGNRVELGEIESTLVRHPGVREAVVVAYEIGPGDKRLAAYVVAEHGIAFSQGQVRDFLAAKLPEYMLPATFILLDSFPLTPSGKVDRQALPPPSRERPALSESFVAPRNQTEEILAGIWEKVIGLERVGIHDNFVELGGDSILSIQITARARQAGVHLTPGQLLQVQTIAGLAAIAGTEPGVRAEQGPVSGPLPLLPVQKWFFEQDSPDLHLRSQSILLEVCEALDASVLEKAVQRWAVHHDALRLRLAYDGTTWSQSVAAPGELIPFSHVHRTGLSKEEQEAVLQSTLDELQAGLNIFQGPLLKLALVDFDLYTTSYLVIAIHDLAVDGVSWRILLEHLELLYQQLAKNQPVRLPDKTTSYKYWAERLAEYAHSNSLKQELPFWRGVYEPHLASLPVDALQEKGAGPAIETVSRTLSVEATSALLNEVPRAYKTLLTDVLLTALADGFSRWTGRSALLVEIVGLGREEFFKDVDLSLTVGCFTARYPVRLDLDRDRDPGRSLMAVKERLRQVPNGGIGYGLLRYLRNEDDETRKLQELPHPEVSFHYMGQLDNLLPAASIFKLASSPPRPIGNMRRTRMDITSGILKGQLHFHWLYNKDAYQPATIDHLAQNFIDALENLITHCMSPAAGRYTPSDFPEANLSQQELDDLLRDIDNLGG